MQNRKTFIKWAGGKEKELPIILKNLPKNFNRYVEPFVGGGAVYLNINCENSVSYGGSKNMKSFSVNSTLLQKTSKS